MEDLENIKNMWIELNGRISALEEDNKRLARKVTSEKFKNLQEKLVAKYRNFIIVEAIMIIYVVLFIFFNPLVLEKYRWITSIYWLVFFSGEILVDLYLMNRVKQMDIYLSSVRNITRQAAENWKFHKIAIAVGFPVAIGAIVLFALAMDANEFVYFGMTVGFMVGLVIGICQLMKFKKYYRLLQTSED